MLDGEDIRDTVLKMIDGFIDGEVNARLNDDISDNWDIDGLREFFSGWLISADDLKYTTDDLNNLEPSDVAEEIKEKARALYSAREEEYGEGVMRELERVMLLKSVDMNWMEHIDAMDQLKQGINLRAYGQHNPAIAYRNEGYDMFSAMTDSIREQTAKLVLTVRVKKNEDIKREKVAEETSTGDTKTVKGKGVVSKNALCPCGSGKKYKRCCGKDE